MANITTRSDIKTAGISSIKAKATNAGTGAVDAAYYALPFIRDGKIIIKTLFTKDSKGREFPYAVDFEATVQCQATHKTNMVKVLDVFSSHWIDVKIAGLDGVNYCSEPLAADYVGARWKLVSDKDIDDSRYVEFTFDRRMSLSEFDTFRPASPPADGTPVGGDLLNALGGLVRADIVASGFSKGEIKATGAGSYDDLGPFRNGKLECTLQTTKDQLGRSVGYSILVHAEEELLGASEAAQAQLSTIGSRENDLKFTMVGDGAVLTLDDVIGIQWEVHNDKDSDGNTFIKVMGEGYVAPASWDGLWS